MSIIIFIDQLRGAFQAPAMAGLPGPVLGLETFIVGKLKRQVPVVICHRIVRDGVIFGELLDTYASQQVAADLDPVGNPELPALVRPVRRIHLGELENVGDVDLVGT